MTRPTTLRADLPRADREHRVEVLGLDDRRACAPGSRDVMTSTGVMPASRRGTGRDVDVHPEPARAAVSHVAHASPAPPRSWMPTTRPRVEQREARLDEPLLLVGVADLDARALARRRPSSPKPAEARTLTPPMPSRPVDEPSSTARLPGAGARPSTSRSIGSTPRQAR